MVTIVYIVPSLIKSGPVNVVYNIVKHLDRRFFNPVIVELREYQQKDRHNHDWFEKLGIRIDRYNYSFLKMQLCLKHISEKLSAKYPGTDVIFHAHGYYPTLIVAGMKGRITMNTIHNQCGEDFSARYNWFLAHYMVYSFRRALPRLAMCAVISDNMMNYYYTKAVRLVTIYNGVDVYNRITDEERSRLRTKLEISKDTLVLLYPAAFSYRKNQSCIIKAIKSCKRHNVLILFAGRGEDEEMCRTLAGSDCRFRFLGYQMDMSQWWNVTDYMISSSISEGMPMAVLESLLYGIPCILSSIPVHKEVSEQIFGKDAILFDQNDPDSLASIIDNGIQCPLSNSEIAEKARKIYSAEVMSKHYEHCYKQLIANPK